MDNPENPVHAELEKLPKETLIELIKMYSRNWHTCDGLWFSGVEERYGTDKALEIDINMWDVSSRVEAKRIKEILAIPDNPGLDEVLRAVNFMSWAAKCAYRIEKNGNYCPSDRYLLPSTGSPAQIRQGCLRVQAYLRIRFWKRCRYHRSESKGVLQILPSRSPSVGQLVSMGIQS